MRQPPFCNVVIITCVLARSYNFNWSQIFYNAWQLIKDLILLVFFLPKNIYFPKINFRIRKKSPFRPSKATDRENNHSVNSVLSHKIYWFSRQSFNHAWIYGILINLQLRKGGRKASGVPTFSRKQQLSRNATSSEEKSIKKSLNWLSDFQKNSFNQLES